MKLLINPIQGGNVDIPCLPLGYLSALWEAPVIDWNTDPESDIEAPDDAEVFASVQSRSWSEAKRLLERFPQARSVTTPIDVQCCYKFLPWRENLHVEELPAVPRYDLFSSFPIFKSKWASGEWPYALMTSHGCPYKCTYCDARERGWKPRPIEDIRSELDRAVSEYNVGYLTTIDDCINLRENHAVAVAELFGEYNIEWACTNGLRADRLTEKSAKAMADSGCRTVGFGIESSNNEVLATIKKGETVEELERGLAIAREHFDSVSGYIILGLPGSDYDTDARTLDWAIDQGIYIHVSYYVPSDDGDLTSDINFYGDTANPSPVYAPDKQESLHRRARGLSWGSRRSVFLNSSARGRLLFTRGPKVTWRYLRMDLKKLKSRMSR
ncbi:MAG: radical SAM protein [Candidatus Latescibacterota bacterium]|nr:radical SAM protein [Candidatus Latescibacterota bacterium]MEE3338997.1 radical SAM protein [Candidatus Latescibacterota bacterium]